MKENLFITSNYFASIADVIYSSREEFNDEITDEKEEIIEISRNLNFKYIITKKVEFEIQSNDIVFCNTDLLGNLFFHLKNQPKLKISH